LTEQPATGFAPAPPQAAGSPVIELRGITRSFAGVHALRGVDLALYPGEVTGLVGENGAGKSTLVKILTGVLQPDQGLILVDGVPRRLASPRGAQHVGVAATFQEPMVFPDLDVAENILAARQPSRMGVIRWGDIYQRTRSVFAELGIGLDPRALVRNLGVADRQLIEIAKGLSSGARVLLLDEPTAVLSKREIESLFAIVRSLRERGIALVFISHKLDEIQEITDRLIVLRDGRKVAESVTAQMSADDIIRSRGGAG
jgi:rhamnose transport system ATP-binding protein